MSRTGHGERRDSDKYQTPMEICQAWSSWAHEMGCKPQHLLDIGAGDGRIGRAFKREFEDLTLTFLEPEPETEKLEGEEWLLRRFSVETVVPLLTPVEDEWLIVSNPPFSMSDEIVSETIRQLNNMCHRWIAMFLLRLNWLGSKKRSEFLSQFPPQFVRVIVPRPSFTGKGTDACEYAIMVWVSVRDEGCNRIGQLAWSKEVSNGSSAGRTEGDSGEATPQGEGGEHELDVRTEKASNHEGDADSQRG